MNDNPNNNSTGDIDNILDILQKKKAEAGTLDFTPDCPLSLLKKQSSVMANYLTLLDKRARIEGVDLSV